MSGGERALAASGRVPPALARQSHRISPPRPPADTPVQDTSRPLWTSGSAAPANPRLTNRSGPSGFIMLVNNAAAGNELKSCGGKREGDED